MDKRDSYIELVKQAQLGDEQSMNCLAKLARERLYVYVRRLVFTDDLTQDILQDSILEMFKSIDKLKSADRFWPWLFRVASNKVNTHYKNEQRRETVSLSQADCNDIQEDVAEMVTKELKQSVTAAMHKLNPQHQKVLFLRCYEELKYSEIAEVMGCSTIGAQMKFLRAKKALSKQLSRSGFSKESLLMALVLFGKMTAPSKAAAAHITVTSVMPKVGLVASAMGMIAGKTAALLITSGLLVASTIVAISDAAKPVATSGQGPSINPYVTTQTEQSSNANEKYWYYYPSHSNGVVMLRFESDDDSKQYSLCLQNDKANYHKRKSNIYINNYHLWHDDLTVWQLPADSPQLTDFISRVQGKSQDLEYVSNDDDGLLVVTKRDESHNLSQVTQRCDVLDKEFFRYGWAKDTTIVDNRDAMHKRGWTYFEITGEVNGKKIYGTGRIPFVYAASREHYPFLNLKMAGVKIADAESFTGLLRPWMGLHTIDTVRRDAAQQGIWFETRLLPGDAKAEVVLTSGQAKLIYTIDMQADVIDEIRFLSEAGEVLGRLEFSYMQEVDIVGDKFVEPRRSYRGSSQNSSGMLWLFNLI